MKGLKNKKTKGGCGNSGGKGSIRVAWEPLLPEKGNNNEGD